MGLEATYSHHTIANEMEYRAQEENVSQYEESGPPNDSFWI